MQVNKETKLVLAFMAITFVLAFFVYFKTVAPTVSFGDSGDFISAAYVLGICHPPGYPLYLIAAKLFSWLPIGTDIAYRINLMSAFFAAFAVSLLYLLILRIQQWFYPEELPLYGKGTWQVPYWLMHFIAVVGALSFAFSSTFWSQSIIAEVHTMNAVFTAGLILTVLAFVKFNESRFLYTAAFLWGLAFGVHQISILYFPVILLFFGVNRIFKKIFEPRTLLILIALAFLGWSVHLYLPLAAIRYPVRNQDSPNRLIDFFKLITRADYNRFHLKRPLTIALEQTGTASFTLINNQFTIFLYWLGIVGLWRMIKKDWKVAGFLLLIASIIWIFFSAVTNFPMINAFYIELREAFFIPAYLLYAVWLALGLRWIFFVLSKVRFKQIVKIPGKTNFAYVVTVICIGLLIPIIIFASHYTEQDKSHYYLAYDLGKAILDTMAPNAIYFADIDPYIYPVMYLQIIEKQRPDVTMIIRGEMYKWWSYDQLRRSKPNRLKIPSFEPDKVHLYEVYLDAKTNEIIELNLQSHPVYFLMFPEPKLKVKFIIIQTGILDQVFTQLPSGSVDIGKKYYFPPPVNYRYRGTAEDGISSDDWIQFSVREFCNYRIRQGDYFAIRGNYKQAVEEYLVATKIKPNSVDAYYHLGVLYESLGDKTHAQQAFENVLILTPEFLDTRKKLEQLKKTQR